MSPSPMNDQKDDKQSLAEANYFSFAGWTVDVKARLLTDAKTQIQLQTKPMQLLLFLADHAGEVVSRDLLVEQVWPDIVINDHALTNIIGKLRKALNDDPNLPQILETIPKTGYRFIASVTTSDNNGYPQKTNTVLSNFTNQSLIVKLFRTVAGLAFIVLFYWGFQYYQNYYQLNSIDSNPLSSWSLSSSEELSIAVLPLDKIGDVKDKGYYSDGMTEEIRYALGQIKSLRVAARTSSDYFRNKSIKVTDIGQQLNVSRVITGTIQYYDEGVRIHMEVTDTQSGFQIWSQQYDSSMNGVMYVKRRIIEDIFSVLELPELNIEQYTTPSYSAYDLYLLGNHYLKQRTRESIINAIKYFKQSIEADSKYVNAYAGLATAYYLSGNYGNTRMGDAQQKARDILIKAIPMEPNNAKALAISGLIYGRAGDVKNAKILLKQSLAINPNAAEVMVWLGTQFSIEGNFERSTYYFREAHKRDPLNSLSNILASREFFRKGNYNSGIELIDNAILFSSATGNLLNEKIVWASQYGLLDVALESAIELNQLSPQSHQGFLALSRSYLSLGQISKFEEWLKEARNSAPDNFNVITLQFFQSLIRQEWSIAEDFVRKKLVQHQLSTKGNSDIFTGFYRIFIAQALWMKNNCNAVIETLEPLLDIQNIIAYPMLKTPAYKFLASCYIKKNQRDKATPLLEEILALTLAEYKQGVRNPEHLASLSGLYAMLGKRTLAIQHLKTAVHNGFNNRAVFYWMPDFELLKEDPEYLTLVKQVDFLIETMSIKVEQRSATKNIPTDKID